MLCTNYHVFEVTRQHFLWKKILLQMKNLLINYFMVSLIELLLNTSLTLIKIDDFKSDGAGCWIWDSNTLYSLNKY